MKLNRLIICIAALSLFGCSENKMQKENVVDTDAEYVSYSGIIPAADGPGISCTLQLGTDAERGNYLLTEQYNAPENAIDITKGTYELLSNPKVKPSGKYYRLISVSNPADTLYFALSSDSTLTMLTPALTPAPSSLDYVLTKIKGE